MSSVKSYQKGIAIKGFNGWTLIGLRLRRIVTTAFSVRDHLTAMGCPKDPF